MSEARWSWMREQTPAATAFVYLNAGWSGPLSLPVAGAMHAWLEREAAEGPVTAAIFADREADRERLRGAMARLLGALPTEVAITGCTGDGINLVLSATHFDAGDNLVTTSIEHPAGIVPAYYVRERQGAEVRIVSIDSSLTTAAILDRFDAAIDQRTRMVLVSHVSYATGQALPLKEIVTLAHDRGVPVLGDAAQVAGHVPVDVHDLDIDYYAATVHKWLCGPEGLGVLYVHPERLEALTPMRVAGPAAARWDTAGGFEPARAVIRKLELGTLSPLLIAGALEAVAQYEVSGPAAVLERVRELNRLAIERIGRISGVEITSPLGGAAMTGLFVFRVAGRDASELTRELQERAGVVARFVPGENAARLSLHLYNTPEDIEAAATALESLPAPTPPLGRADGARRSRFLGLHQ